MAEAAILERTAIVRRGKRLEYFTIAWNAIEGLVTVVTGTIAGSISLVGFGIDSFIEVTSGSVLLWRMSVDADADRERNERRALRVVGFCFVLLAAYIAYESVTDLWFKRAPEHSVPGMILACVSLVVMPILSRAKRKVGSACGQLGHARGRQANRILHLSFGDPPRGSGPQRFLWIVVGRPGGGFHHGPHHCEGGNRGITGQSLRGLFRENEVIVA